MNLKELNYIVTIADEGSISRAAEKLYMAQSSLSQFLQLYEAELGAPLFMRTSRGVRPTASGSVFLNHARQILLQYHRAQSELWDIEELSGGRIELGISTFRGTYLLPPVLKRFRDRYPKIHVEITEKDSMYLEEMILEGLLDMALLALPSPRLHKQLDFLTRDEIYMVAVSDHPIMELVHREEDGKSWVDLRDAARFECILGPPKTILGSMIRKAFEDLHLEPLAQNTNITAPSPPPWPERALPFPLPIIPVWWRLPVWNICPWAGRGSFWIFPWPILPANTAPRPPWPWQRCFMRSIRRVLTCHRSGKAPGSAGRVPAARPGTDFPESAALHPAFGPGLSVHMRSPEPRPCGGSSRDHGPFLPSFLSSFHPEVSNYG